MSGGTVKLAVGAAVVAAAAVAYFAWQRQLAAGPLEWSGTVQARTVQVGSRVGGRVLAVLVQEGDEVAAGQSLIALEPGELPGQQQQALGQLAQMEANLAKVTTRRGQDARDQSARGEEIAAAQARLSAEEVAVVKATLDLNRQRVLATHGATTQADLENADIAKKNAEALRAMQRAQLDQLVRGTPQDVRAAAAQVQSARGRIAQVESQLGELTIRAPRASRVEALDLRPGDILAPDAPAATLLEPDQRFVRIYVPETRLGLIHLGQEIPVYVDTFPGRAFKSVVESISGVGEFTPRNLQTEDERADQVFAARLRLVEGADVLRQGMTAFARVKQ